MEKKPNAEIIAPQKILSVLSGENKAVAEEFMEFAAKHDLTHAVKFNEKRNKYKCVFSSKKPKRVILTVETSPGKLIIKSNLYGIDEYKKDVNLSENIIAQAKSHSWACAKYNGNKCNDKCRGGVPFTNDGNTDYACIASAFSFDSLSRGEWRTVMAMTEKELETVK